MSPEPTTLVFMIGTFLLLAAALKLPAALATAGAAVVGLLVSGNAGVPRHLVEGMFGYFDAILIIATAMVFMKALEEAGILDEISGNMVRRFGKRRIPLALASMVLVMIPGMLTGSSTAAALTTGRFVLPVLIGAGFSRMSAGVLVAIGSILGMIAPPVNIPVMIIGSGIDMPYVGFDLPLLFLTIPPAFAVAIWAALSGKAESEVTPAEATATIVTGVKTAKSPKPERASHGIAAYVPLVAVLLLMMLTRLLGGIVPDLGIPLIFAIGAILAGFCGRRIHPWKTIVDGVGLALPVMGTLVGAGMFVQVMTLSGVRGLLVTSALDMPRQYLFLAAVLILPAFGAISAYASSSVMGVPLLLAFLGNNEIVTASALSLMAAMGDIAPPIALVPTLVGQAIDPDPSYRGRLIRRCALPAVAILIWAFIVLWQAPFIGKLLG